MIFSKLFTNQQIHEESPLRRKDKIDRLERTECFETFTEIVQTLICDFGVPVGKSTNPCPKRHLREDKSDE